MSLSISVKGDVDRVLRDLPKVERKVKQAASRTLNRLTSAARTAAARELSRKYVIKLSVARKRLKLTRATQRKLTASLWAGLLKITAKDLGDLSQFVDVSGGRSGASAGRYFFPGAFIGKFPQAFGENIYKRVGRARHPIRTQGIEIDQDLNGLVIRQIDTVQAKRWDPEFNKQLQLLLARV